ncbi:MAG: type IV secretion system DNA-binding domain-containing protein [Microlunatus sp.]
MTQVAASRMVFARVYPPRPLDPVALETVLLRLASDPTQTLVALEARSTAEAGVSAVSYWLGAEPEHLRWLRRTLHDLLPGLVVDPAPVEARRPVTTAARIKVRPPSLALAVERPVAVSTALLSALNQQLLSGEELVVQIVLGPRRSPRHQRGKLADPHQPWWQIATQGIADAPNPVVRQHQQRLGQAGMATCIRFGLKSEDGERRGRLLTGLLGGISTAKAPGTFISLGRDAARQLDEARPPWRWEFAPSASELVGLLAWPLGDGELPGLPPLHPRLLPAPVAVGESSEPDRVVGVSTVPGDPKSIRLSATDGLFHLIATGPTGSGKSTALLHLIRADVHAGRAVVVIDPKRQLVDDIVARAVPAERIDQVVILDPADPQSPGFNPLDIGDRDPDVVVDGLLAVFAAAFSEGWGPRTQDITHAGLATLARVGVHRQQRGGEPFTLLDLPRLFTDAAFRRSVIGHLADDPALGSFWAWYDSLSPQAQAAALAAPANKWRQYLMRPSVRRVLGQPQPRFRLRDVFRRQQVLLVPLNEGLIGPITAQLLGGLIVAETWAATLERAKEQEPTKRPASVWVDEVQNYLHLPTSLDDALNASRSMGVGWNLAHQFRAQLPPAMAAAVDSNARTKLVFRPNDPKDATAYARMAPELEPLDFLSLGRYEAYATVVTSAAQQPWCSLRTLPPPELSGLAERIRHTSKERSGPEPAAAEPATEIEHGAPLQLAPVETPVGRKRRGARS